MKKILLILVLAGLGFLGWTFTPATLQPIPDLAGDLPKAKPPAGMSLSALPTGSMESQAAFAYRGGSFSEKRQFTMTAFLVHHPRGDILIDSGFGRNVDAHAKMLPKLMQLMSTYQKGTPVADQFVANKYDTKKLAGVIITHAHWDHVSGLDSLPGVPVLTNATERAFIDTPDHMTDVARSLGALNYRIYDFEGGPYLGFAKSHDVYGDGSIVIVPSPGHTPGSVVVFVTLPSGARYAMLGDLVWQTEGIELPAERPWISRRLVDADEDAVRPNLLRVAAIHKRFPEMHLIPAHDARAAQSLPVFPAVTR